MLASQVNKARPVYPGVLCSLPFAIFLKRLITAGPIAEEHFILLTLVISQTIRWDLFEQNLAVCLRTGIVGRLVERDRSKPEEVTSNKCSGIPSLPPVPYDVSRMASFVWSHTEPTLYRAAAVSNGPAGDACP